METLIPVRPAREHQLVAHNITYNLLNKLDLSEWQPMMEVALRDDDERSLSADITIFDKDGFARICIEIYKKPFSENNRIKRYKELLNYDADIEEIFFIIYKQVSGELFAFEVENWYRFTAKGEDLNNASYSEILQLDLKRTTFLK
jgi:hypothetical protein